MSNKIFILIYLFFFSCKYFPYESTEGMGKIAFSENAYKNDIGEYDNYMGKKIIIYISWVLEEQIFAVSILENKLISYEYLREGPDRKYYRLKKEEYDYILNLLEKYKDFLIEENNENAYDFSGLLFIKYKSIYSSFNPCNIKNPKIIYFLLKLENFLDKNLQLSPFHKDFLSPHLEEALEKFQKE